MPGLRGLLRSPGFALTAIAVLALGIGANTAAFSVVDTLLLTPPPFDRPQDLVVFTTRNDDDPATRVLTASLEYIESADAMVVAAVVPLLAAVALIACRVHARRAMRVQPMEVLRND